MLYEAAALSALSDSQALQCKLGKAFGLMVKRMLPFERERVIGSHFVRRSEFGL